MVSYLTKLKAVPRASPSNSEFPPVIEGGIPCLNVQHSFPPPGYEPRLGLDFNLGRKIGIHSKRHAFGGPFRACGDSKGEPRAPLVIFGLTEIGNGLKSDDRLFAHHRLHL